MTFFKSFFKSNNKGSASINGISYLGYTLAIVNDRVYVDGVHIDTIQKQVENREINISITGDMNVVAVHANVTVNGNVQEVDAGGNVNCHNVEENVDAGGSIKLAH